MSMTPKKLKIAASLQKIGFWTDCVASSLGKYVCIGKMSLYSTKLDQLYRFIARKNISRNLCHFIRGIHKFDPILSLHRCRKIFVWFFLSLHRRQKFCPTKLYRFIRFFSQQLCICNALNDTFLSIAAHHWLYVTGAKVDNKTGAQVSKWVQSTSHIFASLLILISNDRYSRFRDCYIITNMYGWQRFTNDTSIPQM